MNSGVRHVPLLYLKFGENQGDVAYDSSPYGNDGALHGPTWVKGILGPGLSFDGLDDYVRVPYASVFDLTDALTIEAWIKSSNTVKADQTILTKKAGAVSYWTFRFWDTTGRLQFIPVVDGAGPSVQGTTVLANNTWYHVVATYNRALMRIYVNGILNAQVPETRALDVVADANVDVGRVEAANYFIGIIDEVRIYSRALTAREVLEHYYGIE